MKSDLHEIEVYKHFATERAVLVSLDGEKENAQWLPISQIEVEPLSHGLCTVTAPEWLLLEKGLI